MPPLLPLRGDYDPHPTPNPRPAGPQTPPRRAHSGGFVSRTHRAHICAHTARGVMEPSPSTAGTCEFDVRIGGFVLRFDSARNVAPTCGRCAARFTRRADRQGPTINEIDEGPTRIWTAEG